jgi:hypothetical protein
MRWAAVVGASVLCVTACRKRDRSATLHPPPGAEAWEPRFAVAFDDGYTREAVNLTGRAPHDVLDQRLFAARLGHAAIVALVEVDQVWARGRNEGSQDQYLDVAIDEVLLGSLPKSVSEDQLVRIAGTEELPGTLQGEKMLMFVRWAPGEQPAYHHHLMPADEEAVAYVEALVDHAKAEGVLADDGSIRKRPGRKKRKKDRGDDKGPKVDVEEVESPVGG